MLDSRYLSLILRHNPAEAHITLDEYGWADVKMLCKNLNITQDDLNQVVDNNTRFIYNDDKTKIKAAHGHSVPIKYTTIKTPPKFLYHGTADRFVDSIMKQGLLPQSRAVVHMSVSAEVARKIAARHTGGSETKTVILIIDAEQMWLDGFTFYESEDGVWLADRVPPKYIKKL